MLYGKRGREFNCVPSQGRRIIPVSLQGESIAQSNLSKADMERDRMIWDQRNSDWAATYEINGQLESQQTELHHANQRACQAECLRS